MDEKPRPGGNYVPSILFFLAFAGLLFAIHLPFLKLPFHWDEVGQFVPAALDLYRDGTWVAHSTAPNVHPPGVMALLALIWHIFGFSILSTRVTMLALASLGVLFSFLLAIRLSRGTAGAPAFAAAAFLIVSPIFYTQSMMALLDMPAMVFTVLALLLFLNGRYALCAAACTVLVLTKETSITTPAVFGCWLLFREKRWREALYFVSPAAGLGIWLIVLHRATGHWLGNDEFAQYNVAGALEPFHIAIALVKRAYFLFISDGHFIGALALIAGWRLLRGKDWTITGLVAVAQVLMVTVLGGAELERYLLPVLPILYAAIAVAASVYPVRWRWISHVAMAALLVTGWFWNSPFPAPYENNLAMVDFVRLQQDAAQYLEAYMPSKRVISAWPFSVEVQSSDFGYVEKPLQAVQVPGLHVTDLAALHPGSSDVLVVYKRLMPIEGSPLDVAPLRGLLRRYYDYHPQASEEEIGAGLGFVPVKRWARRDQWIEIYVRGG